MKTMYLLLLLTCATIHAQENGRFQLFSGSLPALDGTKEIWRPAVFRIDTVTGQVWRLNRELIGSPAATNAVYAEGWSTVSEDFNLSMHIASQISGQPGTLRHLSKEQLGERLRKSHDAPAKPTP